VDEAHLGDELAALEAAEARLSAERRRLQQQIDSGFATESTRARERKVSHERWRLHRQIDALREQLGVREKRVGTSAADWISPGYTRLESSHTLGGKKAPPER
jgi:hypothetical protein